MLELILYFGPVILVVLLVLLIITQGYVKAPPDRLYYLRSQKRAPGAGRPRRSETAFL